MESMQLIYCKCLKIFTFPIRTSTEDIESLADDKKQYLKNEGLGYMKHTLELGYDYWTTGAKTSSFYRRS